MNHLIRLDALELRGSTILFLDIDNISMHVFLVGAIIKLLLWDHHGTTPVESG